MIPKIIHYCWFGRAPLPETAQKCIASWRKYLPDYEIKEWNEENFDVEMMPYTSEAYFAKKYAFVSDVARLYALVNDGGIYLDTDMHFLKSIPDSFLDSSAFVGIESNEFIATSLLASEPNHPIFTYFFEDYKKRHFFGLIKYSKKTNVHRLQEIMIECGFVKCNKYQEIANVKIYPQHYFCNKDYKTGIYYNNESSYAIHDFSGTWSDNVDSFCKRIRNRIIQIVTIIKYTFYKCNHKK